MVMAITITDTTALDLHRIVQKGFSIFFEDRVKTLQQITKTINLKTIDFCDIRLFIFTLSVV